MAPEKSSRAGDVCVRADVVKAVKAEMERRGIPLDDPRVRKVENLAVGFPEGGWTPEEAAEFAADLVLNTRAPAPPHLRVSGMRRDI